MFRSNLLKKLNPAIFLFAFLLSLSLSSAAQVPTAAFKPEFCADKNWTTFNASGAGTLANPYLICRAAQLANIGTTASRLDKHYKLMGNIDLAPYYAVPNAQFQIGACGAGCVPWDGAFVFSGTFDGNGYSIRNFTYSNSSGRGIALFAATQGAVRIRNLRLMDVNVTGGVETGGLVGFAANGAVIDRVMVTGNVAGNGVATGGIVGYAYWHSVVSNSTFSGIVTNTEIKPAAP